MFRDEVFIFSQTWLAWYIHVSTVSNAMGVVVGQSSFHQKQEGGMLGCWPVVDCLTTGFFRWLALAKARLLHVLERSSCVEPAERGMFVAASSDWIVQCQYYTQQRDAQPTLLVTLLDWGSAISPSRSGLCCAYP